MSPPRSPSISQWADCWCVGVCCCPSDNGPSLFVLWASRDGADLCSHLTFVSRGKFLVCGMRGLLCREWESRAGSAQARERSWDVGCLIASYEQLLPYRMPKTLWLCIFLLPFFLQCSRCRSWTLCSEQKRAQCTGCCGAAPAWLLTPGFEIFALKQPSKQGQE